MSTDSATPPHDRALSRRRSESSPRHLLVILLGDYWQGRHEHLPSAALVRLVQEFDVTAVNARAVLSRLARQDVLEQSKSGRMTLYGLTPTARRTLVDNERRVMSFGAAAPVWDGDWTVAVFSLPEERRDTRHLLRSKLRWLGLAPLYDGVWTSPHAQPHDVLSIMDELDVPNASVVRGRHTGAEPWSAPGTSTWCVELMRSFAPTRSPCWNVPATETSALPKH